jgi:hypothetical protein
MANKQAWIVTTSGQRPLAEVLADLKAAGLSGTAVLAEIGCITGKSDHKSLPKLRAVRGVADIAPDGAVDLGPPDSPHTW